MSTFTPDMVFGNNQRIDDLSIKFYYIRNFYNEPVITLCTMRDTTTHELQSMGVAVCSRKDMPVKKVGKIIAQGRAMKNLQKGVIFSQHALKNVKIVQETLINCYWVDSCTGETNIPYHVNTFIQFLEFDFAKLSLDLSWYQTAQSVGVTNEAK